MLKALERLRIRGENTKQNSGDQNMSRANRPPASAAKGLFARFSSVIKGKQTMKTRISRWFYSFSASRYRESSTTSVSVSVVIGVRSMTESSQKPKEMLERARDENVVKWCKCSHTWWASHECFTRQGPRNYGPLRFPVLQPSGFISKTKSRS